MKQRIEATIKVATPDGNYDVTVHLGAADYASAACYDYYRILRVVAGVMPDHDDMADIAREIALQPGVRSVHVIQRDEDPAFGVCVTNEEAK